MEKPTKPQDLYIGRNRLLTAIATFVWLASGVTLAVVTPLAMVKYPPESEQTKTLLIIALSLWGAVCLLYGILNLRNLFFHYILTADEKGIYNYSGLFHYGFISWEDVEGFSKEATVLDVMDGDPPCLRIFVKDFKKYKSGISLYRKMMLLFGGCNIKIYTLCSQIKRKELYRLLNNMLSYYNAPEQTVDINE
ncbi:MAG: hypothetical protein K2L12_03715 [Clostridia bacterium]|nr:hypothetical protein [Clostridia bacterium]